MSDTNLHKGVNSNSPKSYVEVNERTISPLPGDKGGMLVLFDWNNYRQIMTNTYGGNFEQAFPSKFNEEDLNKRINDSLRSASVTLSDKLGGSRATVTLENFAEQWMFESNLISELFGQSIFTEGMYITIDAKGRFSPDRYYRIFTGTVEAVEFSENPTDRTVTLSIVDYSRILNLTRYNLHPAMKEEDLLAGQGEATIWGSNVQGLTNIDIAKTVLPNTQNFQDLDKVSLAFKELWKLYDVQDDLVSTSSDIYNNTSIVSQNFIYSYPRTASKFSFHSSEPLAAMWGDKDKHGNAFQVYANVFNLSKLFFSEYKTRLNMLNEAAALTLFNCYIDGSGNFHFHPPRYDNVIRGSSNNVVDFRLKDFKTDAPEEDGIFVLLEDESLSESYSQSEQDITTRLWVLVETDYGINTAIRGISPNTTRINLIWGNGIRRFGLRERTVSTAAFDSKAAAEPFAYAIFIRTLLERFRLRTSMPMRPELQVDRPFYVPHKNRVYHIRSITHSYDAGSDSGPGTYSTSVDCFGGRPMDQVTLLTTDVFRDINLDTLASQLKKYNYDLYEPAPGKQVDKVEASKNTASTGTEQLTITPNKRR